MGFLTWAKGLDDRLIFRHRQIRRRTALRLGWVFFAIAAVEHLADHLAGLDGMARSAAVMALLAGIFLGRATEHDLAKKDLGLLPDP